MRFTRSSSSLLLILAAAGPSFANPFPRDDLHDMGYSFLRPRNCPSYCGSENRLCCESHEYCTTLSGNIATCLPQGGVGGYVGAWTTTWTETHTYTSTLMTWYEPAPEPTAGVDCVPKSPEQEACGNICCAGWQTCAYLGQCSAKPGYGEGTTIVVTSNGRVTTQYSAPYRVTGTTTIVTTDVRTDTPTTGTAVPAETTEVDVVEGGGGTGGDLSPGAIAGIVIGVLAGISLLLLLCFCCIARGLWVAFFGKKKDDDSSSGRRERVDVYEERYSRHGSRPPSAYSRRDRHKGWFGGGGGPSSASERKEKKSSSGKKWLGIAGLAATLLALLNLKKDKKPARSSKPSRSSRYSDSYYSYSDYTSPSGSSSSDRRTSRTHRTRPESRPRSYYSRSSRRP